MRSPVVSCWAGRCFARGRHALQRGRNEAKRARFRSAAPCTASSSTTADGQPMRVPPRRRPATAPAAPRTWLESPNGLRHRRREERDPDDDDRHQENARDEGESGRVDAATASGLGGTIVHEVQ